MRMIKPQALKRGDVIGICAPASPPGSEESLNRGIRYIEQLGYRVEPGRNIFRKRGYLAGTDLQRASDLNELFADRRVRAIFTVRGGYGSHRILPLLKYTLIRRNPKILVGYSDITALHLALLTKAGLVTFTGPMVVSDMAAGLTGKAEEVFWNCLTSRKPPSSIHCGESRRSDALARSISTGQLIGGNLSIVSALVGTPYFPTVRNPVLLLEEIDEKPYRIDRMLRQIRLAGILRDTTGIVMGKFIGCTPGKGKPSLTLRQVFDDSFRDFRHPILSGLQYGHLRNLITLPLGIRVRLDGAKKTITFLEAGVT